MAKKNKYIEKPICQIHTEHFCQIKSSQMQKSFNGWLIKENKKM